GVHHLHEVGIIHRDLKPGNLMVTEADHRVVVMDLGLAVVRDASRSITKDRSALLGTLRYVPPEQLQRNLVSLDRRADVYSLGVTL
ncbi:protein kinase domain-containing protein, partial [Streptomyces scabiei]